MRSLSDATGWQLVPSYAHKLGSPLRERLASAKAMLTHIDNSASRIITVAIFLGLGPQLKGLIPAVLRGITRKLQAAWDTNRARLLTLLRVFVLAIQRRLAPVVHA